MTGTPHPQVSVVDDHSQAYSVWRSAGAACPSKELLVLHVDKHDDLELPEPDVAPLDCTRPNLRNNNFLLSAVICRQVSRVVWVFPDFECAHCSYASSAQNLHRCVLGIYNSTYFSIALDAGESRRRSEGTLCCSEKFSRLDLLDPPIRSAEGVLLDPVQYQASFGSLSAALGESGGDFLRRHEGAFSNPYVLDIDLDFFVSDEESPKMRGPPDVPFAKSGTEGERFDTAELAKLLDWIGGKNKLEGNSILEAALYFDLRIQEAPPRMNRSHLRERLRRFEAFISRLPRPPCAVSIARSNVGGYTPCVDTMAIERGVLGTLERVWGLSAVDYTRSVLPEDFDELAERLKRARRISGEQREDDGPMPFLRRPGLVRNDGVYALFTSLTFVVSLALAVALLVALGFRQKRTRRGCCESAPRRAL